MACFSHLILNFIVNMSLVCMTGLLGSLVSAVRTRFRTVVVIAVEAGI